MHSFRMADNITEWLTRPRSPPYFNSLLPTKMRAIHNVYESAIFITSLLLNLTLILLIFKERNKDIMAYSKVLLQNSIVDLFSSFGAMITKAEIAFNDGYIAFTVRPLFKKLPLFWYCFMSTTFIFCVATAVHVIGLMSYFRYLSICKQQVITTWGILIMLFLAIGTSMLECFVIIFSLYTESSIPQRGEICARIFDHPIWWDSDKNTSTLECVFTHAKNPFYVSCVILGLTIHSVVYALVLVGSIKVAKQVNSQRHNFSQKTQKLQRQMNIMLLIQVITTIFVAMIPIVIVLSFPIFHFTIPGIGIIASMLLSSIPIFSPIITLTFVSNFRNALVTLFTNQSKIISEKNTTEGGSKTEQHIFNSH